MPGEGLEGIVSGVFVGTHKFFFFIPAKHQTATGYTRNKTHITEKISYRGKSILEFMDSKVRESGLSLSAF